MAHIYYEVVLHWVVWLLHRYLVLVHQLSILILDPGVLIAWSVLRSMSFLSILLSIASIEVVHSVRDGLGNIQIFGIIHG